mgnify:CR=1 FL=1
MFRHGFIVLAVFVAVLANSVAAVAMCAPNDAVCKGLVSSVELGSLDEKGSDRLLESDFFEGACSSAHQLGLGTALDFRLASDVKSIRHYFTCDRARFGSEPAPNPEPPSA